MIVVEIIIIISSRIHRSSPSNRQACRETGRQAGREAGREAGRQAGRHASN